MAVISTAMEKSVYITEKEPLLFDSFMHMQTTIIYAIEQKKLKYQNKIINCPLN